MTAADRDAGTRGLESGARVVDRDAASRTQDQAVVLDADEQTPAWQVWDEDRQATVAELNPEYSEKVGVAEIAFVDDLTAALDREWRGMPPGVLADVVADADEVDTYAVPLPRLRIVDAPARGRGRGGAR